MFCGNCGHDNPADNNFCGYCGTRLISPQHLETRGAPKSASAIAPEQSVVKEPATVPAPPTEITPEEPRLVAVQPEPLAARAEEPERSLHGPSFLGLSEDPADDDPLGYLLEDEPKSPGRWRWYAAAIVVLGFAAVLAYEWKQTGGLHPTQPKPAAAQIAGQPATGQPAAGSPPPPPPTEPSPSARSQPPAGQSSPPQTTSDQQAAAATPEKKPTPPAKEDDEDAKAKQADEEDAAPSEPVRSAARQKPTPARPVKAKEVEVDDKLLIRGENYLYGRGVPKSCDQALIYLRAAARQPNPRARSQMGALYATGQCVQQDRVVAYQWFTRALDTDPHNVWLERNREMLWRQMSADERRRAMEGGEVSSLAR